MKIRNQYSAKKWEYKDGRMLTVREITELHPEIGGAGDVRRRLREHTGDWEYTLRPKRKKEVTIKMTKVIGMGPRMELEDIKDPTDFERKLWGY